MLRRRWRGGKHETTSSRDKSALEVGTEVVTQNMKTRRWDRWATIVSKRPDGKSYEVSINGGMHLRDSRFLRLTLMQRYPTDGRTTGARKINRRYRPTRDTKQIPRASPYTKKIFNAS